MVKSNDFSPLRNNQDHKLWFIHDLNQKIVILWGFQASFIGFIAYYSRIDSGMFELVQTRPLVPCGL